MTQAAWRVIVADDEPAARRGLRQLLAPWRDFQIVGECRNGAELLEVLDRLNPDLVFLDIQMPGIDGFEAIRRRSPERMPTVVFLTAYEQHALRAFEVQAFDYLVKPVTAERFAKTISWLRRQRRMALTHLREPTVAVKTSRGCRLVPITDFDWFEAADNYSRAWRGTAGYLVRVSLSALEIRGRAHGFRRAHRNALVRLGAIATFARTSNGTVAELKSGARIPISRRRRGAFLAATKGN